VSAGASGGGGQHGRRTVSRTGISSSRALPLPERHAAERDDEEQSVTDSPIHLGVASIRSTRPR
jgi:hypothetical protein